GGMMGGGGGGGMMGGGMGGGSFETYRMLYSLQNLIIEAVDPLSWVVYDGDASIDIYGQDKLVISQTIENHKKIQRIIDELMKTVSHQVAIEVRFLLVTEKFLEDVGLDLDFQFYDTPGDFSPIVFNQQHAAHTAIADIAGQGVAAAISGTYGSVVDDLFVGYIIEATQRHSEGKVLNAPKITVRNNSSAVMMITEARSYVGDYEFEDITTAGFQQPITVIADPQVGQVMDGIMLDIIPTISKDKRYVALQIVTMFSTADLSETFPVSSPQGQPFLVTLPLLETATIRTRVNIPDEGTLLIGGQKLSRDQDIEEGVPILSKIPLIGRAFRNRSQRREQDILLILVRPKIILQEETEAEAVAMLEEGR
ncbi:type II secretion system protein GspD, partial [Planctomycetota bacterium]